jgi:hypothetical protein
MVCDLRFKLGSFSRAGAALPPTMPVATARAVFVKCSGMHTATLRHIVDQICCRGRWVSMPFSCAEFVYPALANGITQYWDMIVSAQCEVAIYSALFMTLWVPPLFEVNVLPRSDQIATAHSLAPMHVHADHALARRARQFPDVDDEGDDDFSLRSSFLLGYMVGMPLCVFNIATAVRAACGSNPRVLPAACYLLLAACCLLPRCRCC